MASKKVEVGKVVTFAGAIVAYLIGSAFATGQEVMQFFTNFGVWQSLGALIIGFIVMVYISVRLMEDGRILMLKKPSDIYRFYGGKYIGNFVKVFSAVYLFCLYVLMLSGAGTVMHEYYGINRWAGSILMMILTLITVLMGLKRMVQVLGKIGPAIIVIAVGVGFLNCIINFANIPAADAFLASVDPAPLKASGSWIISGILNPTAAAVLMVPFLAGMGTEASSKKEAIFGGGLGGFLFIFGAAAINFGILASLEKVYHLQAPALGMADIIYPGLGVFYSVIVVLGIFTTAVPLLWAPFMTLEPDETSVKFKAMVVVGAIIALFGGQLHFSLLINIIIPIAGWVGILITICVIYKGATCNLLEEAKQYERLPGAPEAASEIDAVVNDPEPARVLSK